MKEAFEKIIERLEEREVQAFASAGGTAYNAYRNAIKIVNQVAEKFGGDINVGSNDGWIPCSERLPEEEYDTVLAVTDRNHYCVAVYTTEHGFRTMDIDCEGDFVAWQPLPESYKGE